MKAGKQANDAGITVIYSDANRSSARNAGKSFGNSDVASSQLRLGPAGDYSWHFPQFREKIGRQIQRLGDREATADYSVHRSGNVPSRVRDALDRSSSRDRCRLELR